MKNLVYPAVVYKDENDGGFTIAIHDLGIVTEGETVVDAYIKAKEYLCAMVDLPLVGGNLQLGAQFHWVWFRVCGVAHCNLVQR